MKDFLLRHIPRPEAHAVVGVRFVGQIAAHQAANFACQVFLGFIFVGYRAGNALQGSGRNLPQLSRRLRIDGGSNEMYSGAGRAHSAEDGDDLTLEILVRSFERAD